MLIRTVNPRPYPPTITYQSPRISNPTRRTYLTRAGLLDRLLPRQAPNTKSSSAAADSIKQSLLDLTRDTDAGIKATPALRQEIEQQVAALEKFCIKSPLTNQLIFGDWQVIWASKPTTAGGPFRSSIGRTVLPGQTLRQVITPPNLCTNIVSFKGLGFISGKVEQQGIIEAINPSTFQLTFPQLDEKMQGRAGGPRKRVIEITYLDEDIRVGRFIPEDGSDMDGSFYIFKRLGGEEEKEEEEEEEEEEGNVLEKFFSAGRAFTTQSEKRQTATSGTRAVSTTSSRNAEAERVERERRIAAVEKEKQLKAEKREQAIAQINELREEATRAANEAREAQGEYRSAEREGSAVLRQAASARAVLKKAAGEVEQALGRLERLKDDESELTAAVAEAASRVKNVRSALQKK
jgi:hypothetical protein